MTKLIPIGSNGNSIAIGGGKYYSLDSSRESFTGGAGVTRFMGIAANGNPAVGQMVPIVSNGATFAWIRKGSPFITFAVFDPVASPTKPRIKKLFREGVTFVPGIGIPTKFGGKSGRHSLSGTITTRKFTPFDQLVQFIVPGQPQIPIVPRGGSWSLTYTLNQYLQETTAQDGKKNGWGLFGTFLVSDETTNPVGSFMTFGLGGNGLFRKRQRDQFGVSYGFAGVSSKLRSAIDPVLRVGNEHTFEAFYNYSITPWLWLTAHLQIVRPVLQTVKTSIVPASRLVIHF